MNKMLNTLMAFVMTLGLVSTMAAPAFAEESEGAQLCKKEYTQHIVNCHLMFERCLRTTPINFEVCADWSSSCYQQAQKNYDLCLSSAQ